MSSNTDSNVENIVNICGRLAGQIEELEKTNKSLREEIEAYKNLVEFQAKNHQEELWERITKAYLSGQKSILDMKEENDDHTLE